MTHSRSTDVYLVGLFNFTHYAQSSAEADERSWRCRIRILLEGASDCGVTAPGRSLLRGARVATTQIFNAPLLMRRLVRIQLLHMDRCLLRHASRRCSDDRLAALPHGKHKKGAEYIKR